jgi:hypothetical protein
MKFFVRHFVLRRSVALLLAGILCGCASWQPVTSERSYVTAAEPNHVRVVLHDGVVEELYAATAVRDKLTGLRREGDEKSRVSIPMRQVSEIQVWQSDEVGTVVLLGAVGLAGVVFVMAMSWRGIGGASSLPRLDQVGVRP